MAVSKLIPCMSIPSSGARRQRISDSSSRSFPSAATATTPAPATPEEFRCYCEAMDSRRPSMKKGQYYSEKKPFEVKAASILISPETKTGKGVDPALILAAFTSVLLRNANVLIKRKPWRFPLQAFLEKAIIDCRFFALLAVAGSLIGSLLCFVDGSFLILESYFQYFHVISQGSDQQGHIVHLLIEAIDMFLVAIAMLVFGIGLHVSFVGSYPLSKVSQTPQSRYLKNVLSSWGGTGSGMGSVMQSKSKIGQAVVMLLQVGVLEKFSSVPLVTGLDLACFAAALFLSSACVFLLSKLTINSSKN